MEKNGLQPPNCLVFLSRTPTTSSPVGSISVIGLALPTIGIGTRKSERLCTLAIGRFRPSARARFLSGMAKAVGELSYEPPRNYGAAACKGAAQARLARRSDSCKRYWLPAHLRSLWQTDEHGMVVCRFALLFRPMLACRQSRH